MKSIWAILLGGLALIGTAEARLGQTIEQVQKDLGPLKLQEDGLYPSELLFGVAHNQEGFNDLYFQFLKTNKRCVTTRYGKYYKNLADVTLGFLDAKKVVQKAFFGSTLSIVESQARIS